MVTHVEHVDGIDFGKEDAFIVTKFNSNDAMALLGISEENSDAWLKKMDMSSSVMEGNKHNRPFKPPIGKRYAHDILKNKFPYNGESMIISKTRQAISLQHRCYAVILAEKLRKANPEKYREFWKGPISIKVLLAVGIDDKVADSTDQGQARANGDVLYRKGLFDRFADEFKPSEKKLLSRELGTAIRTVWLRVGGKRVSDAPHFPKSEMLAFLATHPKIVDCVVHVYRQDDGKNKLVRSSVSIAYMAAVMYLAATAKSDREDYDDEGEFNTDNMSDAEDFVSSYASGYGKDVSEPCPPQAIALKAALSKLSASSGASRDEKLNLLVKGFVLYLGGINPDGKVLSIKKDEPTPRLGGLDVSNDKDEEEEDTPPKKKATAKKATKKAAPKKAAKKAAPKKTTKNPVAVPVESEDDDDTGFDEFDNDDDIDE